MVLKSDGNRNMTTENMSTMSIFTNTCVFFGYLLTVRTVKLLYTFSSFFLLLFNSNFIPIKRRRNEHVFVCCLDLLNLEYRIFKNKKIKVFFFCCCLNWYIFLGAVNIYNMYIFKNEIVILLMLCAVGIVVVCVCGVYVGQSQPTRK